MLNLPHQQVTADIAFPRVETADIEAVVVEAMDDDFILGKERKQLRVQVNLAEKVKVADIFNRDGLALHLPVVVLLLKVKGVLLAPQSPAPKDVVGLRHQANHLAKTIQRISPALRSTKRTKSSSA
jgi:hypothetical protein